MSYGNGQIRTGSYAVTTVYSMPWSKKKTTTEPAKRKRAEKKVVHEIFEKCAELTTDQYWITVFNNCSRDKFPRGFFYKNGLMTHRRGNKINRVSIPNSAPEASSVCMSFFKTAAGLMSTADRMMLRQEEERKILELTSNKELTWKDIKTEKLKELLIMEFVDDISNRLRFNKEEKNELITTVKSGFMLKCFTSKNIQMKDGSIIAIEGLIYDKKTNTYDIDPQLITKKINKKIIGLGVSKTQNKPKVSFMALWDKYLQGLEKRNQPTSNFQIINGSKSDSNSGELYSTNGLSNDTPNDTITTSFSPSS